MASWYNNIISSATTGITKLLDSEKDGDTDDDTLVCRVLRARYTARGLAFPPWLPPDPKAPPPAPMTPAPMMNSAGRYGAYGSQLQPPPQQQQQQQQSFAAAGATASKLGSLWDRGGAARSDPQVSAQAGGASGVNGRSPYMRGLSTSSVQQQSMTPPSSAGGGGGGGAGPASAGDRLRQRLRGGARTASPSASGPYQPPPPQQQQQQSGGGRGGDYDPYRSDAGASRGGGGGGGGGYGAGYDTSRPGVPSVLRPGRR